MKRIITFSVVVLLAAFPVAAQFTTAEKAELKKLAQSSYDLGSILVRIGTLRRPLSSPLPLATHVKAFAPQLQYREALKECGSASEFFAGVPIRYMSPGLPRPAQVAGGFAAIDRCIVRLQNARPDFVILATAHSSQAANVTDLDRIIVTLQSMNRAHPYTSPFAVLDAPLVGNHGDLELALKSHASIHDYAVLTHGAMNSALQEIDGAVTTGTSLAGTYGNIYDYYYEQMDGLGHSFERQAATWLGNLDVLLDSERAVIQQDLASGSGLRGFDFFRLQRANENVGAASYNFTKLLYAFNGQPGRNAVPGIGLQLYQMQLATTWFQSVAMGDATADAVELRRRSAVVQNVYFQIDSMWVYVDKVRDTYIMFHHSLPLPPNVCIAPNVCQLPGGGMTCGTGTHPEGNSCVADPCPTCPPVVTCSVGTHSDGNTCVADPCPTCPPVPLCPTFLPTLDVLSDRILARCVQQ